MRNKGAILNATFRTEFHSEQSRSNMTKRIDSISNLRKPVFNATCAVSVEFIKIQNVKSRNSKQ
ncbi:hypothetical protein T12_14123 [Trichinella patagoniensis]|uniref:Uncharacterized protein n=1 Tax=Trichinella patagoniensis TaxID=990121 RepID=A0A0V0Z677_9BILA|nr:hypothetical protein T12_14123 [Trichinella patagoniensis]